MKRQATHKRVPMNAVCKSCSVMSDSLHSMDYTVHGILQARILGWVAFPFSKGSSQPGDWTQVSCITVRFFTIWATREALRMLRGVQILNYFSNQGS